MAKIIPTNEPSKFVFFCPGCNCGHYFNTSIWSFNNDFNNPTVRDSILVWYSKPERRCHSFVTDGNIQFLDDCFHNLKGQTIPLPDFDSIDQPPYDPEAFPPNSPAGEKAFWDNIKSNK